jgi:short-subunit dehydrogenase
LQFAAGRGDVRAVKTAVVTGAGRGLGRLIAKQVAQRGFAVLATDIDRDSAEQTASELGEEAWATHQDVRDPDSHHRIAEEASERGDLKLWVNNAGVMRTGLAWEHDDDDVRLLIDVNVLGVIWGSRAGVRALQSSDGGQIINIASMSSLIPAPGLAVYAASKHAVLGFSTSLQGDLERAQVPIQVSALCPDAIDTHMAESAAHDEHASLMFSAMRLLKPEKVAKLVGELVDHPRLVLSYPPHRAVLAHALRPWPSAELRVLKSFTKFGDRQRRRRASRR